MKSRILQSSYVIDFLDIDFSSAEINHTLKIETDKILEHYHNDSLNDWEILFRGIYGKGTSISVYRALPSYVEDKQKQITVHIPVPIKDIVKWGVNPTQLVTLGKAPNELKNISLLEVDFNNFTNRTEYILDCFRRAIKFCFEDGFTINKVKVKIR